MSHAKKLLPVFVVTSYAGLFALGSIALLHILKPERDITWSMVSEYAIGEHGWLMAVAFFLLATAYFGVFFLLRKQIITKRAKIGRWILLLGGLGLLIGGMFTSDPIITPTDQASFADTLHDIGALFAILGTPIAALFITSEIAKKAPWKQYARLLWVLVAVAIVGFVSFVIITALTFDGVYGPDVPIGIPNRISIAAYALWVSSVGLIYAYNSKSSSS